jgi:predicted RNA-binding Zn ribbon-like protein
MRVIYSAMGNANRFGGGERDDGFDFELSGGALALDFANTLDERPRGGAERLTDYARLLQWSQQAGVLSADDVALLAAAGAADPVAAGKVLESARALRELIFATARRSVEAQAPTTTQVRRLTAWARRAAQDRRLEPRRGGLVWLAADRAARLDAMLPPVADSIVALLTDRDRSTRLRLCAAETCDWLFLDTTRRRNRIWCDMSVCGNRTKARRHYYRNRETA